MIYSTWQRWRTRGENLLLDKRKHFADGDHSRGPVTNEDVRKTQLISEEQLVLHICWVDSETRLLSHNSERLITTILNA